MPKYKNIMNEINKLIFELRKAFQSGISFMVSGDVISAVEHHGEQFFRGERVPAAEVAAAVVARAPVVAAPAQAHGRQELNHGHGAAVGQHQRHACRCWEKIIRSNLLKRDLGPYVLSKGPLIFTFSFFPNLT